MASTYTPIATQTLSTNTSSVTFSSIPQTYTDLVAVLSVRVDKVSEDYFSLRLNGDTAGNYSMTYLNGDGSAAVSGRFSGLSQGIIGWTCPSGTATWSAITCNIMNYTNTTTYKTYLSRSSNASFNSYAEVGLWRSTAAITSVSFAGWGAGTFGANNMIAGSTLSLYGIKAA